MNTNLNSIPSETESDADSVYRTNNQQQNNNNFNTP